jgi:hypothetical protein
MTLRRNLMFAARRWARLERHRKVGEIIERFDLAEAAGKRPGEVAAEARLRGEMARALLPEPRLLLADDRGWTETLVRQLRAASACPIVLVTGDLDLCCAAADNLAILSAGRIVQRGAPRQVLDQPESLEVARLLGIPNLFPGTIAALDPGHNSSRLELERFSLTGPTFAATSAAIACGWPSGPRTCAFTPAMPRRARTWSASSCCTRRTGGGGCAWGFPMAFSRTCRGTSSRGGRIIRIGRWSFHPRRCASFSSLF